MTNIDKYSEDLSTIDEIRLREHISKSYELAEELGWCEPDEDLDIQKKKISDNRSNSISEESVVPVIRSEFDRDKDAQSAYTELQRVTNSYLDVRVHDVYYDKEECTIAIVLSPFEIEKS